MFKNRKKIIILITVIVSCLAIAVGVFLYFNLSKNTTEKSNSETLVEYSIRMQDYNNSALELALNGDYDGAQNIYDEALKKENSNTAKADLYRGKSVTAFNASKYEDAYSYAVKSYELNATFASADIAAQSAELSGKKDESLNYYKLALSVVPENTPDTTRDKNRITAKIQELESKK